MASCLKVPLPSGTLRQVLFTDYRIENADVLGGLYSVNAPKASLGCWEANLSVKPAATTLARMFDNECCIY